MFFLIIFAIMAAVFAAVFLFAPKGTRTLIWNTVGAIVGPLPLLLDQVFSALQGFDWTSVLDKTHAAFAALVYLVGSTILRFYTNTTVGQAAPVAPEAPK